MRNLLAAVFLIIVSITAIKANTIIVGGGAPFSNCSPFDCDSNTPPPPNNGYQQVYAASALGTVPINISSLTFYDTVFLDEGYIYPATYTFTLSSTTADIGNLSSSEAANIGSDATAFWSGHLGGLVTSSSFTVSGTNIFYFSPTAGENLLLTIDISNIAPPSSGQHGDGFNQEADGSIVESRAEFINGVGIAGTNLGSGLETGFGVTAAPEPLSFGLVGVGLVMLLLKRSRRLLSNKLFRQA